MFVMIEDDMWVREETIERVFCSNGQWQIMLNGGQISKIDKYYAENVLGSNVIKQIIPAKEDTWGRYCYDYRNSKDQTWYRDKIDAFALCGDGSIRPINYMSYFNGIDYFMDENSLFEMEGVDYCDVVDKKQNG